MCECGGAARNIGDFCVHYIKCIHVTGVAWYKKLKPWNEVESWERQIGNRWSIPTAQTIFEVSSCAPVVTVICLFASLSNKLPV